MVSQHFECRASNVFTEASRPAPQVLGVNKVTRLSRSDRSRKPRRSLLSTTILSFNSYIAPCPDLGHSTYHQQLTPLKQKDPLSGSGYIPADCCAQRCKRWLPLSLLQHRTFIPYLAGGNELVSSISNPTFDVPDTA